MRLAEEAFRVDIPGIAIASVRVPADEFQEVRGRVAETLTVKILRRPEEGGYDLFRLSRGRDTPASFSSYAFHTARSIVWSALRDERRQASTTTSRVDPDDLAEALPPSPSAEHVCEERDNGVLASTVLTALGAVSWGRMRGARRTHVSALAARVALGLPENVRPSSAHARATIRSKVDADPGLALDSARHVLMGEVVHPDVELVWEGWDADALGTVIGLGRALARGLVLAAVEDYPRPAARPLAALVRQVTDLGDATRADWVALAADLVRSLVAVECESISPYSVSAGQRAHREAILSEAEGDRAAWPERLARAVAWPGAPLGSTPVVAAEYLRTLLLDFIPVPTRDQLLDAAVGAVS